MAQRLPAGDVEAGTIRRARLYESVRTAHLERAQVLPEAAIVYRRARYDFDSTLAAGLTLVSAGPVRAALLLRRWRLEALEVNEPLMRSSLVATSLAVFAVRAFRRRPPRLVAYAIENADPFATQASNWRGRIRRAIERRLAHYVWRRLDAVAFGTEGAQELYRKRLPDRRRPVTRVIPALPARSVTMSVATRGATVVFLGAFVSRKGLPLLLDAWPYVRQERPGARLRLVGKGELADLAVAAAVADDVEIAIDPPRSRIREILEDSRVLVLPSQPRPDWREQVGLPIVEGLECGCSIVTTDETGLAPWLASHGHTVIPGTADAVDLARAIVLQLDRGDQAEGIARSLPDHDGRLDADIWMFAEH